MDRLTKYSHFITLSHPFTASTVADLFFAHIVKLHGLPRSIITDRDSVFLSNFWQDLFKTMGTILNHSMAYHPQTDGQTERVNQCVENYLRCMVFNKPHSWAKWIDLAEWWYSAIQTTPFKALYGYEPPLLPFHQQESTKTPAVDTFVKNRRITTEILRENIARAQACYKQFADAKRTERSFEIGDMVFLKIQPYRQSSVRLQKHLKLRSKYFGPFKVIQKIGAVANKLELPAEVKIHPIFHVLLLKKKIGPNYTPSTELPTVGIEGHILLEPIAILERRLIRRNNLPVTQVLIQWSNSHQEDATWEDWADITTRFLELKSMRTWIVQRRGYCHDTVVRVVYL